MSFIPIDEAREEIRQLKRELDDLKGTLSESISLLNNTISIMRQGGLLPGSIGEAISKMQRAIMVANQLRLAMIALTAASGPWGMALAGVGLLGTVITSASFAGDLFYDQTRTGR